MLGVTASTHVGRVATSALMSIDGGSASGRGRDASAVPSDADLMASVAAGESRAFDVLVERHQRAVVGYLIGMLSDREEALDCAQEVFVRVFTRADRYKPDGPFRAWLYRIATNIAIDTLRGRKRLWQALGQRLRPRRDDEDGRDMLAELPAGGEGALGHVLGRERDAIVHRALASLPVRYRSALVLREIHELSYDEVAGALGCRVGTVKSRINRARTMLREKLAAHQGVLQ